MRKLREDPYRLAAKIVQVVKDQNIDPYDLHRAASLKISAVSVLLDTAVIEELYTSVQRTTTVASLPQR